MAAGPKAVNPELSRTWSDRSTTFMAAGSPGEGLEAANLAIRYDAGNITARENKTLSLVELEQWDEALQAADQTLALKPNNAAASTSKAIALTNLSRCSEALQALDRALKVRPEGAVLWFDQARCRAKQGERERALKSLAKAIALDPKLKSAAVAEADLESLRNDPDFLNLVK